MTKFQIFKIVLILSVLVPVTMFIVILKGFGYGLGFALLGTTMVFIPFGIAILRMMDDAHRTVIFEELKVTPEELLLEPYMIEVLVVQESSNDVFESVLNWIKTEKISVVCHDATTGTIIAKTGMSLNSWGERILIMVSSINDDKSQVIVSSKPKTFTKWGFFYDFGMNIRNVRRIKEFLERDHRLIEDKSQQEIIGSLEFGQDEDCKSS